MQWCTTSWSLFGLRSYEGRVPGNYLCVQIWGIAEEWLLKMSLLNFVRLWSSVIDSNLHYRQVNWAGRVPGNYPLRADERGITLHIVSYKTLVLQDNRASQRPTTMGNKSSNPEHYARWKAGAECCHPRSCYKVTELRWIRVPMASDFATGAAEVGRWTVGIATLGLSAVVNGGIKDLSHECIEIVYTCERCAPGNWQRFTTEIMGKRDTYFTCGYYSIEKDARHTHKPASMTVADVESKYNQMGSYYNFMFENCSHWCSQMWHELLNWSCMLNFPHEVHKGISQSLTLKCFTQLNFKFSLVLFLLNWICWFDYSFSIDPRLCVYGAIATNFLYKLYIKCTLLLYS